MGGAGGKDDDNAGGKDDENAGDDDDDEGEGDYCDDFPVIVEWRYKVKKKMIKEKKNMKGETNWNLFCQCAEFRDGHQDNGVNTWVVSKAKQGKGQCACLFVKPNAKTLKELKLSKAK